MKVISLFNHKGGVSKTTTAFNLGWALAEKGYKTLLVDADPQCNLTALILDYNSTGDIEDYYKENPNCDIYSGIEPIVNGAFIPMKAITPVQTGNPNLQLMAGNIKLAEAETQISVALTTSSSLPAMQNIPGAVGGLIRLTAEAHGYDYIIIDMSPSVGALNQCLLMSSDYFIVPTFPDFFCAQAVNSLAAVFPRWSQEVQKFRSATLKYPFPINSPKFLGIVSQKYRPRNSAPAKSFQRWIDVIKGAVKEGLIPALSEYGMVIPESVYDANVTSDGSYNLANIPDFNSLIAQSQKHNIPVFALTDAQIEQVGVILEDMSESRDKFRRIFEGLADSVHKLTEVA